MLSHDGAGSRQFAMDSEHGTSRKENNGQMGGRWVARGSEKCRCSAGPVLCTQYCNYRAV